MVYGYSSNEEFIDKSYQLLEKLDKKGLWNKDTLVIGLDKSVRPLAYTLRKLSSEEKRETPNIRFFNYSSYDYVLGEGGKNMKINFLAKKYSSELSKLDKFKNIILLDNFSQYGDTIEDTKKIVGRIIGNKKKSAPKIYPVLLNASPHNFKEHRFEDTKDWIFVESKYQADTSHASSDETGIEDKHSNGSKINSIRESIPIKDKETRQKFLANRYKLSSDIKNYLYEKHPEKVSEKNNSGTLERIVSGVFIFSFLVGLFLSSNNLTGNVIGSSGTAHKLFGIILVLVGIGGFFIYRKLK